MVQKKVGRPRNFDMDTALEAAVNVFWAKGYDGSSIRDLTDAMGINSPSLYAVFGDKHSLYLKAIERYTTNDACEPLVAFESEPDIHKAVRALMNAALDYATQKGDGRLGCFLGSCVATNAGSVEGVKELLQQAILATDLRIAKRFDREKSKGNLPGDFPSLQRARLMLDLRQGHVLRARAGLDRQSMAEDLNHRVQIILD
ncbi:HTH-type transcriptional repressor ComR [Poriferisphaera corsica]|uniref:HTH-type transcriptional repressor ComR n=1 Tax=Poriferisphaera corsica TaxID=2528020 RepID=A0A517YQK0_9BACT|nr:TetR/AcrR family transcriptional regulator [Poriferisphaera corsica]QDU32495.1 HTH-type transcriptional repressor ComR [Poriferisphaera corsica]